ncbi:MAG TPA: hypothetical protein VFP68_23455 [Burkholderiaceae bacterium]|nr:hypothetical protein [Burkholderiaceae bacterium]
MHRASHPDGIASPNRVGTSKKVNYLGTPSIVEEDAYLNPPIRGVNFAVNIGLGTSIRAVVSAEVLKAHFGAKDDPKSWVTTVKRQMGLLQWLAELQWLASKGEPLVLTLRSVEAHLESERKHHQTQQVEEDSPSQAEVKARLEDAPSQLIAG